MCGYVYKFLNEDGDVVYIGSTGNITKRMYKHFHDKDNGKMKTREYKSVKNVSFCETKSRNDAYILEIVLIQKYKPEYNTVSVNDGDISLCKIDESSFSWRERGPMDFGYGPHNVADGVMANQYHVFTKERVQAAREEVLLHLPLAKSDPTHYRFSNYQAEKAFVIRVVEYPEYWTKNLSKEETERMLELLDALSKRMKSA